MYIWELASQPSYYIALRKTVCPKTFENQLSTDHVLVYCSPKLYPLSRRLPLLYSLQVLRGRSKLRCKSTMCFLASFKDEELRKPEFIRCAVFQNLPTVYKTMLVCRVCKSPQRFDAIIGHLFLICSKKWKHKTKKRC